MLLPEVAVLAVPAVLADVAGVAVLAGIAVLADVAGVAVLAGIAGMPLPAVSAVGRAVAVAV